ncbi:MAG: deoxyribonucleoside regulator [Chloroflexota bacterium]|nr:deoxyribonucleoside regulator [Chloroflexota bacterium]
MVAIVKFVCYIKNRKFNKIYLLNGKGMDSDTRRQLLAEVATLYYKEKKTQSQIGRRLGYSRSAISRLLSEAEQQGIVEITIKYPLSRDSVLERRLKEKYHLEAAFVVNSGQSSYDTTLQLVGRMGAFFMEQVLKDETVVGIGWGTSISELVRFLPYMPLRDVLVVQVIGAVGGQSNPHVDGPGVAANFATKLNADYNILHSPLFLDNDDACRTLKQQKQIAETLDKGVNANIALLGIGTIEVDPLYSSIYRSGFMSEQEVLEVKQKGGVGNFCGVILDDAGRILDHSINYRTMAVDLKRLRDNCKMVVGVAAGERKCKAIESVLKGNWLDVLVTDSAAIHPILD